MTKLITRSSSHHNQARHGKKGVSFCPQNNKEPFTTPINRTVAFFVLGRAISVIPSAVPAPTGCTREPSRMFGLQKIPRCGQRCQDGMSGTRTQRFHFTTLDMTHLEEVVLNLLLFPIHLTKTLPCSLLSRRKPSALPCNHPCIWEAERYSGKNMSLE